MLTLANSLSVYLRCICVCIFLDVSDFIINCSQIVGDLFKVGTLSEQQFASIEICLGLQFRLTVAGIIFKP